MLEEVLWDLTANGHILQDEGFRGVTPVQWELNFCDKSSGASIRRVVCCPTIGCLGCKL